MAGVGGWEFGRLHNVTCPGKGFLLSCTMPARLTPGEIQKALQDLPDWELKDANIVRTFTLGNFVEAVEFLNQLTELAEDANHHPDVDIRWNKVHLVLTTHDSGGLTVLDLALAGAIDRMRPPR